jgi:hypothetical protein
MRIHPHFLAALPARPALRRLRVGRELNVRMHIRLQQAHEKHNASLYASCWQRQMRGPVLNGRKMKLWAVRDAHARRAEEAVRVKHARVGALEVRGPVHKQQGGRWMDQGVK